MEAENSEARKPREIITKVTIPNNVFVNTFRISKDTDFDTLKKCASFYWGLNPDKYNLAWSWSSDKMTFKHISNNILHYHVPEPSQKVAPTLEQENSKIEKALQSNTDENELTGDKPPKDYIIFLWLV